MRLKHFPPVAVIAACLGLSACSSNGSNDWIGVYRLVRASWDGSGNHVHVEQASAIPYATLGIRLDDGPEQILVLATDSENERLWASSSRVVLKTRHGRIVSTAGLAHNVTGQISTGAGTSFNWKAPHHEEVTADFADDGMYSVLIQCDSAPAGTEEIEILGAKLDVVRVEENCRSTQLGWSYTNTYWVSQNSQRVWRSVQHVHPKGETIEIELLRPPLSDN